MYKDCTKREADLFLNDPISIQTILFNRTVDEAKEYLENLKKMFDSLEDDQEKILNNFEKYLDDYTTNYETKTIIELFCGFYGIQFNNSNVDYSNLPEANMVIFNISYNFNKPINYKYTADYSLDNIFITKHDLDSFKPYFEPYNIVKKNKPYEKIHRNDEDKWYVVLNYCESQKLESSTFKVSQEAFTERQMTVLTNGGYIKPFLSIHEALLKTYKKFDTLQPISVKQDFLNILQLLKSNAKRLYSVDYAECVNNWINFIKHLMSVNRQFHANFYKALALTIKFHLYSIWQLHEGRENYYMEVFKTFGNKF